MTLPLVSVITVTYNHEKYLGACIDSVIHQSFKDWEMIIIDDESIDETEKIAKDYVKRDSRIRYFRQPNQGIFKLSKTYNSALDKVTGRYVAILEGDDLWKPGKLEKQIKVMESDMIPVLSWGKVEAIDASIGKVLDVFPHYPDDQQWYPNEPHGSFLNLLYLEDPIPAPTLVIRKSALDAIGGFQGFSGLPTTDLPTLLELVKKGLFYYDKEVLAQWRQYSTQTTKLYPVEMITRRYEMISQHFNKLEECFKKELVITKEIMDKYFNDKMLDTYARSGRYRLLRKDFSGARNDYLHAIFYKGKVRPMWRIRAITGLIFSLFHKDVEGLSRMCGKVSYKS